VNRLTAGVAEISNSIPNAGPSPLIKQRFDPAKPLVEPVDVRCLEVEKVGYTPLFRRSQVGDLKVTDKQVRYTLETCYTLEGCHTLLDEVLASQGICDVPGVHSRPSAEDMEFCGAGAHSPHKTLHASHAASLERRGHLGEQDVTVPESGVPRDDLRPHLDSARVVASVSPDRLQWHERHLGMRRESVELGGGRVHLGQVT